jgi:hypothetical protein
MLASAALTVAVPSVTLAAVDLGNVVIAQEGWRYNLTIMREQAKTSAFKAQQYQYYLTKLRVTDEYIVAYAAAVAEKFGTSSPPPSPPPPPPPPPPAVDPILGNVEIRNEGWRYNLTIMKVQAQYSAAKAAEYVYYRDKNRVTDAYVDAYARAVAAKFNPDDVSKDIVVTKKPGFKIYRGFRFKEMPTYANCGLSEELKILYEEELFGTASKAVPNISLLQTKVIPSLLKRNPKYVVIDIEHWDPIAEMDKLITVIRTLKQGVRAAGNTTMQFGYYMLVPIRDYLAPTTRESRPGRWSNWLQQNETMKRLAAEVDVVFPSLYTPAEKREDWLEFARTNIAEARKYGKPVIAFIWPQYHNTAIGIGTTYLPVNYWDLQMRYIYNLADGMAIWGSVAFQSKGWDTWDKTKPWWPFTRQFAAKYTDVPQSNACDE